MTKAEATTCPSILIAGFGAFLILSQLRYCGSQVLCLSRAFSHREVQTHPRLHFLRCLAYGVAE